MDARGKIYASKDLNDTNLIGQVGRDNVVALIYRHDPIEVSSPAASLGGAPADAPLTVAVLPGEHHSLTDLLGQTDPAGVLERVRLRRRLSEASSNYWLLIPGGVELSLTRELGDSPGVPFKISGGEHRIAGEIGERIQIGRENV